MENCRLSNKVPAMSYLRKLSPLNCRFLRPPYNYFLPAQHIAPQQQAASNCHPSLATVSTFIRTKMSQYASSVQKNIAHIFLDSTSSYESLLRDSIELKLYYLRDTTSPVEFDELVDEELQRVLCRQTTQCISNSTSKSFSESFKNALRRFLCF